MRLGKQRTLACIFAHFVRKMHGNDIDLENAWGNRDVAISDIIDGLITVQHYNNRTSRNQ